MDEPDFSHLLDSVGIAYSRLMSLPACRYLLRAALRRFDSGPPLGLPCRASPAAAMHFFTPSPWRGLAWPSPPQPPPRSFTSPHPHPLASLLRSYGLGGSQLADRTDVPFTGIAAAPGESVSDFMRLYFGYEASFVWWTVLILAAYVVCADYRIVYAALCRAALRCAAAPCPSGSCAPPRPHPSLLGSLPSLRRTCPPQASVNRPAWPPRLPLPSLHHSR